jgi:hypothetical protein
MFAASGFGATAVAAPDVTIYAAPFATSPTGLRATGLRAYGDGVDGAPSGIERAKMVVVVNPI